MISNIIAQFQIEADSITKDLQNSTALYHNDLINLTISCANIQMQSLNKLDHQMETLALDGNALKSLQSMENETMDNFSCRNIIYDSLQLIERY